MANGTKIRGVLLVVLGLGLAIFMWVISDEVRTSVPIRSEGAPPRPPAAGPDPRAQQVLALLSFLAALGVSFAVYGIYMAVTGKQSLVVRIVAGLLLVAIIVGSLFIAGWPPLGFF